MSRYLMDTNHVSGVWRGEPILFPILTYDELSAREYGRIRAQMKQKGVNLSPVDTMIAAVALVHDLTILTSDRDFLRIPGLKIENWLGS